MPEAIAPQTPAPAPEFKPQPTVDEVHARVQADLAQQSAPQTAPEAPSAHAVQDPAPSVKTEPPKAPSDLEKLQRQHARQQREWQAANQLMQQKYEAQLKDLQAKLEALGKPQSPAQPDAPKADPVADKVERILREIEAQKSAQAERERKAQEAEAAQAEYAQWQARANEVIKNPEYADLVEYCTNEDLDPVRELAIYTNNHIQQRGYPCDVEAAAEDLTAVATRKLSKWRSKYGSNASTPAKASPTNQTMPGTGGIPAPGTQGAPVTTQDRLDALVDHYSKSGFFKDQPF